ncbi:MAG: hypothetical protein A3D16_21680 [Rhodobacterales bacterium RIFCSPHIGHO2_02_FULL_62_130]|nr:MAG: hypothetical protein A3D16_21680 [Rhodobacterales bacterium RIFCSPHIGHO2_02_FULL_62_130]OHC61281.1 MAG: hypothetical protein A3E48_07975 [Rhodobacterales bacterium RIFCSPHIGHO2_12_FULL_62_75]
MRDENSGILEVRVWVKDASGAVLIGERFRKQDGLLTMTWHVDPKSILGVMWVEEVNGNVGDASAS